MRMINHYHILLVDDEYYLRQSIQRIMQQMDTEFRVTAEAGNGASNITASPARGSIHIFL